MGAERGQPEDANRVLESNRPARDALNWEPISVAPHQRLSRAWRAGLGAAKIWREQIHGSVLSIRNTVIADNRQRVSAARQQQLQTKTNRKRQM
jgi:hypothetical protein